ncbi:MAG: methyltransferase domain-containing protein [Patescibacteria group bacterium]
MKTIIYNKKKIPYKDNSFDVALILTVLHHTPDPIKIIKEAKRVAKRIIIVEDVYENNFQKLLTFVVDSIINFEFFKHPHSNKSDNEWIQLFKNMGLKLLHKKKKRFDSIFLHSVYYLE